jgi:hypothetical protein
LADRSKRFGGKTVSGYVKEFSSRVAEIARRI